MTQTGSHTSGECIDYAKAAERLADVAMDTENREILLDIARRWRKLAAEAEASATVRRHFLTTA